MSQYTKLWRTLVRVASITEDKCYVILPGWNVRETICLDLNNIPKDIQPLLFPGKRFHAQVNIGAENKEDLKFENWEKE